MLTLISLMLSYLMMCCPLRASAAGSTIDRPNRQCTSARTRSGQHAHDDLTRPSSMRWSPLISPPISPAVMTVSHRSSTAEPSALDVCRNPRNCVVDSPDADDPMLRPIPFRAPIEQVVRIMAAAIAEEPRTRIVIEGRLYLRAEARSALFRFVDDVELLADEHAGLIHFRSASRIGLGDLGVNRRRMRRVTARIRQRLADLSTPAP